MNISFDDVDAIEEEKTNVDIVIISRLSIINNHKYTRDARKEFCSFVTSFVYTRVVSHVYRNDLRANVNVHHHHSLSTCVNNE